MQLPWKKCNGFSSNYFQLGIQVVTFQYIPILCFFFGWNIFKFHSFSFWKKPKRKKFCCLVFRKHIHRICVSGFVSASRWRWWCVLLVYVSDYKMSLIVVAAVVIFGVSSGTDGQSVFSCSMQYFCVFLFLLLTFEKPWHLIILGTRIECINNKSKRKQQQQQQPQRQLQQPYLHCNSHFKLLIM